MSPAEPCFAVASCGGRGPVLALWGLRQFAPQLSVALARPDGFPFRGMGLAFNHNGKLVAVACADGLVRLYDTHGLSLIASWDAHPGAAARAVAFGHAQASVFSVGSDGVLAEWSIHSTRRVLRSVSVAEFCGPAAPRPSGDGHTPAAPRTELAMEASGAAALLSSATPFAGLVDLRGWGIPGDGRAAAGRVAPLRGAMEAVASVDWHPQAAACVTGSEDGVVRLHDLEMR